MITVLLIALKEILFALVGKLAFRAIAERFASRIVIFGLKKLRDYSDNDVVDGTVTDVINSLQGKKLHVMDKTKV